MLMGFRSPHHHALIFPACTVGYLVLMSGQRHPVQFNIKHQISDSNI